MTATAQSDPTLELLERFEREGAWAAVKRGVPIFKPHERKVKDKDGSERTIQVTAADLEDIAQNADDLERTSGVPLRMTIGHVQPSADEKNQPPLAGYARNLRPGKFGPSQEPCLLADLYFLDEHYQLAREYPYRSAEFYPAAQEVRGVALLKRDPQLALGVVTYDGQGRYYRYAMDDDMDQPSQQPPDPAPAPAVPAEGAGPPGHEEWAGHMEHYAKSNPWLGSLKSCYEAEQPPMPATPPGGAAAPAPAAPIAPSAAPIAPSAAPMPAPDELQRMQRDSQAIAYQRQQAEIAELRSKVASLTTDAERAKCEQMVTQLEAEHYQLDRAAEVELLLNMTPTSRQHRCDAVRKYHQRHAGPSAPVLYAGSMVPVAADAAPPGTLTEAQAETCLSYMREHDCDWETAKAKALAG